MFLPDCKNISAAKENGCPINLIVYMKDGEYQPRNLSYFLQEFIFVNYRTDLMPNIDKEQENENLETKKLILVSKINSNKDGFWLSDKYQQ
jgi:hypothetical protein